MRKNKFKLLLILFGVFDLVAGLLIGLWVVKRQTLKFPEAEEFNTQGRWDVHLVFTEPQADQGDQIVDLIQDASGNVNGVIMNTDGSDPVSFTGTVTGNKFVSGDIVFTGVEMGVSYKMTIVIDGTIASGGMQMSGTANGRVEYSGTTDPVVGTFTAVKQSGTTPPPTSPPTLPPTQPPTQTATPTITPSPTPTSPTGTNNTATPTPTQTSSSSTTRPTNTPVATIRPVSTQNPNATPLPDTGYGKSTIIAVGSGVALIVVGILSLFAI